jgi:hypothetical protein
LKHFILDDDLLRGMRWYRVTHGPESTVLTEHLHPLGTPGRIFTAPAHATPEELESHIKEHRRQQGQ